MDPATFIALAGLGVLATGVAMASRFDIGTRVLASAFSMITWAIWSFSALNIEHVTSCCVMTREYRSLAFLGAGAAGIMLLFLLQAVFGSLRGDTDSRIDKLEEH